MNKTSDHVNNYANLKPFSTSDDIYIKSSNNIEHSPLRLPNYFVKKETTNDHARTETICQSREVPAEYLRHNNNQSDQNRQNCLSQKLLPNSKDKPSLISVHEQNEINYQGNQHSMPSPTLTIYDNESPKRNNIVGSTMKINQPRRQCIVLETKASFIETPNSAIIIKDQQQSKVQVALSSKKTKEKANLDTPFPTTRSSPQVPEWLARLPLIDDDNSTKSLAFINDTTDKNKSDMCKMTSTKQHSLDTSPLTQLMMTIAPRVVPLKTTLLIRTNLIYAKGPVHNNLFYTIFYKALSPANLLFRSVDEPGVQRTHDTLVVLE